MLTTDQWTGSDTIEMTYTVSGGTLNSAQSSPINLDN